MTILNIRNERINNGWTLQFVGDQIGITKQAVHDIEKGRRKPSYKVMCKLEKLFGKSHDYLFAVNNQLATDTHQDFNTIKKKNKVLKGDLINDHPN